MCPEFPSRACHRQADHWRSGRSGALRRLSQYRPLSQWTRRWEQTQLSWSHQACSSYVRPPRHRRLRSSPIRRGTIGVFESFVETYLDFSSFVGRVDSIALWSGVREARTLQATPNPRPLHELSSSYFRSSGAHDLAGGGAWIGRPRHDQMRRADADSAAAVGASEDSWSSANVEHVGSCGQNGARRSRASSP